MLEFRNMTLYRWEKTPSFGDFMLSLADLLDIKECNVERGEDKMDAAIISGPEENHLSRCVNHINDRQYIFDFDDTHDTSVWWNKADIVFKSQYYKELEHYYPPNIVPFTYFEQNNEIQTRLDDLRRVPKTLDKIIFRGTPWIFRHQYLQEAGLWNTDLIPVPYEQYIQELTQQRMTISIPGYGLFCHREFECFAVGTPVITTELKGLTYNPLIPGVHYIAVDSYKDVIDVQKNISDKELKDISEASMQWYDENVKFPNSAKLALSIMEKFDKKKEK